MKKRFKQKSSVNPRRALGWSELISTTYVCFDCRVTRRARRGIHSPTNGAPKCQECSEPMHWLGKIWRAPKRTNIRAWERMKEVVNWTPKGLAIRRRDRGPGIQMKRQPGVKRQRLF